MTPNGNTVVYDRRPSLAELMDERIRDVFDTQGTYPELEDQVRLVGIGYTSPERRPYARGRTMEQEMVEASRDYKIAIIL